MPWHHVAAGTPPMLSAGNAAGLLVAPFRIERRKQVIVPFSNLHHSWSALSGPQRQACTFVARKYCTNAWTTFGSMCIIHSGTAHLAPAKGLLDSHFEPICYGEECLLCSVRTPSAQKRGPPPSLTSSHVSTVDHYTSESSYERIYTSARCKQATVTDQQTDIRQLCICSCSLALLVCKSPQARHMAPKAGIAV